MIKEKLTAKKQIRKLRVEKKKIEAELSILKVAGVDSFPIASEVLNTKALHLEGMIEGIRWMVNTSEKEPKKVKRVNEPVPPKMESKKAEVVGTDPTPKKPVKKKEKVVAQAKMEVIKK